MNQIKIANQPSYKNNQSISQVNPQVFALLLKTMNLSSTTSATLCTELKLNYFK
jgi:uncharacterized protein affecting Mg2+/Co2+ transport